MLSARPPSNFRTKYSKHLKHNRQTRYNASRLPIKLKMGLAQGYREQLGTPLRG
jgi:hypothetical protein